MKHLIIICTALLLCSVMFTNCSDSKQFNTKVYRFSQSHKDSTLVDTIITAKPYGWINRSNKIEGVEYQVNTGDVIWSILLLEVIFPPILITGKDIMEPVGLESKPNIKIAQ